MNSPAINILPPEDHSRFEYLNNPAVVELTAFLFNNSEFIVYAAAILDECLTADDLHNSKLIIDFYEENSGDDLKQEEITNNSHFIDLIYSFYSIFSEIGKFSNFRGAVLERLALIYISGRYLYKENVVYLPIKKELLSKNCQFDIDCKVEITNINWITEAPIDLAAWNSAIKSGEGYECKIKLSKVDESDEKVLSKLKENTLLSHDISFFNVAIITFSSLEGKKYYFEYLDNSEHEEINLYGRNNLDDLKNIR